MIRRSGVNAILVPTQVDLYSNKKRNGIKGGTNAITSLLLVTNSNEIVTMKIILVRLIISNSLHLS